MSAHTARQHGDDARTPLSRPTPHSHFQANLTSWPKFQAVTSPPAPGAFQFLSLHTLTSLRYCLPPSLLPTPPHFSLLTTPSPSPHAFDAPLLHTNQPHNSHPMPAPT